MNILCVKSKELSTKEFYGWGKAINSSGNNFVFWDKEKKPVLDVFYEKKPDAFMVHANDVDRATKKAIVSYNECKTVIFNGSEEMKYHENVFISPLPNKSLDIYNFIAYKRQERFFSNINYVGDYVDVKDNVFLNLLNNQSLCIKLWGNTKWPYRQYVGKIKSDLVKDVISSCSLSLYSDLFSDFSWALQVFSCGKPCFMYKSKMSCDLLGASNFNYETEEDLVFSMIDFLRNTESLEEEVFSIRENIRNNHTSHNRASDFLNIIGLKEEAEKCIIELQKIILKY
jgi:hypothetical protein